ncbi:EamA family transporter [Actinomycetospora sp. CA-101289]|uniref:EamA family transporter n=1 Tax=Actinomycetospora sp. CA-101289 TaxID=3239893 RepID=UPI003D95798F
MGSPAGLLGLVAALSYGVGDFVGGALSRRLPALTLLVLGQGAALLVLLPASTLVAGTPGAAALAWGAGAGVAGAAGSYCFLRGFATGRLGVVTPTASVTAAGLPVLVDLLRGVAVSRPAAIGIVLALVAVVLVGLPEPRRTGDHLPPGPSRRGVGWGLGAGAAHAVMYVLLGEAPTGSGLWPAVALFVVIVGVALAAAWLRGARLRLSPRQVPAVLTVGALSAAGTVAYLLAAGAGSVGVAAVTTELSPVVTAVLARVLLAEPLPALRTLGLALAVVAGVLIGSG